MGNDTLNNMDEVSLKIKDLSNEIDKMLNAYVIENKSAKTTVVEEENLSSMYKILSSMRDKIGDVLMKTGRSIHSKTADEKEIENLVSEIELELTPEDFDAVPIIDYMSSKKIAPKADSLSEAEANLIILSKFKDNPSMARVTLIHKANIALLLHKNLSNPSFVNTFAKRDEMVLSESSLINILDKYKDYKEIEQKNLRMICKVCGISFEQLDRIKKHDFEIKKIVLNKEYPSSISVNDDLIRNQLKELRNHKAMTPNEAFIAIGESWLSLGLPDPKNKLKSQIDAKFTQGFADNVKKESSDNKREEFIDVKIKTSKLNLN